jgi:hypothetical protein
MKNAQTHANRKIAIVAAGMAGLMAFYWWSKRETMNLPALSLIAPGKKFAQASELKPENIATLLAESKLVPISDTNQPVAEPELPVGFFEPPDAAALGFGRSKFLVDSRWATVRYLGENPAGAGLNGAELNKAQLMALGSDRDTIPVITAVQTINDMMENYFVPLMRKIPRGDDLLARIKVQGAYFSPRYQPDDGSTPERDNAFVIGVQSLFLYPNSCFDKSSASTCSPVAYSAGHDPSIIGHELGHVIFNHMRDERTLEGWQWFAVNEGYADYFSASYFGDPILGRIWRVTRPAGARYLRKLLDTPTTNDEKALEEGHAFGVVWSSALWRSRNRIMNSFKVSAMDFDRIVLMSINFLGETTKTKLGDAASAMLKAADVSGLSGWKSILIDEFKNAEVDLSKGQRIVAAQGEVIEKQQGGISCGTIPAVAEPARPRVSFAGLLLVLPLLMLVRPKKPKTLHKPSLKRKTSAAVLAALFPFLGGCQLFSNLKNQNTSPEGLAITYGCNLSALQDGTPLTPAQRKLSFTFLNEAPPDARLEQIFVGDERFQNADSSLILIVDRQTMRIDQIRRRDGNLFQINLNQKYVSSEDALAVQNMKLASIILEGVGRALLNQINSQPAVNQSTAPSAVSFELTGIKATATLSNEIMGARGFGPLASEVRINDQKLCSYEGTSR